MSGNEQHREVDVTIDKKPSFKGVSRRHLLRQAVATGAGLGALSIGGQRLGFTRAWSADHPAIGTWPDGASGSSVTIGATVPRTGAYAVQGEDELKGMELAVEHINEGHELIKKIAPKVSKGVLGKQVNLVVADSGAKPNDAVQEQQTFINENKIIAMTGSTSSAVAVALNKFAEREKILYLVAFRVPTTPPARTARATASASASTARPRPTRSARCWSRISARTRRRRS